MQKTPDKKFLEFYFCFKKTRMDPVFVLARSYDGL